MYNSIQNKEEQEKIKKTSSSFDNFIAVYGVDRSVARGLRTLLKVAANGTISEEMFVKGLKAFTSQKPH